MPCLNGDPVLEGITDPKFVDLAKDLYIAIDAAVYGGCIADYSCGL